MASTFFFYDLETSGFNARAARVMQFAGQRTDMDLKPLGKPVNVLIKLSADVLPEPDAVLLTGITPQKTLSEGLTEAEFLKLFYAEVVQPNTIFLGFNSVRFDDEFMRFLLYRNYYDAYEWQWKDGCSRWDLLDLVRMTRALRPDGIEWPYASDGKPANRLEYLSQVNKLAHANAHDALSDVMATIGLAKLVKSKQPELFDYLLKHRDKKTVKELVLKGKPFVYTTGRYSSQYLHTSAVMLLSKHPEQDAALVYDLRYDPTPFIKMEVEDLVEAWRFTKDPDAVHLPVKTLKYNRCPAVAPLGVINDASSQKRIDLNLGTLSRNLETIKNHQVQFSNKIALAIKQLDAERQKAQVELVESQQTVDERLYDGFINASDKNTMSAIRAANPQEFAQLCDNFMDDRLKSMIPLYKARNFPKSLSEEERQAWDEYCQLKLFSGGSQSRISKYFVRLAELNTEKLTDEKRYLLEELKLYGEAIVPADEAG